MSLIEEALRKQQEENDKTKGDGLRLAVPATPPPVPPPVPESGEAEEDPAPRRMWPILVGAILGGILLVGGVAWLLLVGVGMWNGRGAGSAARGEAGGPAGKAVAKAATDTTAVTAVGATEATGVVATVSTAAVTAVPTPPVQETPVAPAPAVTATPPVVTATVGVTAAPPVAVAATSESPVAVTAPVKTVAAPVIVTWPKLTVSGLIGSSRGGKSAAIINGQMVGAGSSIEGVRIDAIDKNGVKLSYEGETKTLLVGGTTE